MLLLLISLAQAAPPAGCLDSVDQLPSSPWIQEGDPRLRSDGLVVVRKSERVAILFDGGQATGCWTVALGVRDDTREYPPGHKVRRGDRRTPEGWYRSSDKPWSQFYGAIAVHYPNAADARVGEERGLITPAQRQAIEAADARGAKPPQSTRLGGEILLHGGGSSSDWTWGCVAFDNSDLDTLRAGIGGELQTDILILP